MKKFYLFTKTLLVMTLLCVGASNAWGTATFWKVTSSTAVTANQTYVSTDYLTIASKSAGTLAGYNYTYSDIGSEVSKSIQIRSAAAPSAENPSGTDQSGSTRLVLTVTNPVNIAFYYRRQADNGASTNCTYTENNGKDLAIVNQNAPTTKLTGTMTPESDCTTSDTYGHIKKAYTLAAGTYTVYSTSTTIQLNAISYEEIVATEVYSFRNWTSSDGVINQLTGEGSTFDVGGVDEDGTKHMTMASHVTIGGVEHAFGNRLAFDNYSSGSTFGWRFRSSSTYAYQNGLVTQGRNPDWSPFYFSVCNLNVGDKVKVTYDYKSGKDAQPYFVSTNASAGGVSVVANTTKMVSGTEYTITTAGHLDLVVKDNNFAMSKLEIIRKIGTIVESAVAEVKSWENSRAFATYIDGKFEADEFKTVEDVYAAHTAWQIAQADAASSNDYTKVIRNAAVSDFTYWNNARNNSGQQYTGAPDNKYFDGWDEQPSDGKQKIYGLPAGTYTIKVATRASETLTDKSKYNVWVYGGSADVSVLGSHIGSTGGTLGNGWNWTILSFTLDEKADVEVGFYANPGEGSGLWAGCDDFHLYKGTLNVSGTITPAGWASFSSTLPLDLSTLTATSGATAYYASSADGSTVTLSTTTATVPAGEGLMIKGTAGETFTIDVTADDATFGETNLLKGQTTTGDVAASPTSGSGTYHYVFGYKTSDATEYGFYNLDADTEVPEGKAYLEIVKGSGGARSLTIVLADDILTGINEAAATTEAVQKEGKFVVDGKLVIFKKGMKFNANGARIY